MRIVHTADWHVGRFWKNIQRLDEMEKILDHLARFLESERIDLLLVAGDLFDAPNPVADAERLVFEFFRRIGASEIPSVVIAGNHESPGRMDAWGMLAELAGARLIGKPRPASKGGVQEIRTRAGETALVAALPFAGPAVFVSALELTGEETQSKALYAERFKQAVAHLAGGFRPGCVNLFMAHTHLDGAVFGNSERQVHLGEDWAATPQALPSQAQYIALGHIHKPQRIEAAPAPTEYAGSPLQLDFGEAGQHKSFVVIEAYAGKPVRTVRVPYEGGKELADLRLSLTEIEQRQKELTLAGWLRLTVPLDEPDPDLARRVRKMLDNALIIRPELARREAASPVFTSQSGRKSVDLYRDYFQREYERLPDAYLTEEFERLYEQCAAERGGD